MSSFRALVKNDIGFKYENIQKRLTFFWVYAVAAVLIWIIQLAIFLADAREFTADPRYVWMVVIPAFLFTSGSIVSREWRRDTVGWWLPLPYSRTMLLGAKAAAALIRFIVFALVMLPAILMLFLVAYLIRSELFTAAVIINYFTKVLQLYALLLIVSPLAAASGILIRLVTLSRWRCAAPLFWVGIPALFSLLITVFVWRYDDLSLMDRISRILTGGFPQFLLFILAEAIFAFVLGLVSVHILEKQIEL